jgi:hypothetical protein
MHEMQLCGLLLFVRNRIPIPVHSTLSVSYTSDKDLLFFVLIQQMHLVSGHNQPKNDVMDDLSNGED